MPTRNIRIRNGVGMTTDYDTMWRIDNDTAEISWDISDEIRQISNTGQTIESIGDIIHRIISTSKFENSEVAEEIKEDCEPEISFEETMGFGGGAK